MKKKILIYTCMWQRYSVSRLFAMGITRFINDAPKWAEVKVLATVSDEISEDLCNEFGFYSVMYDNLPLGRKWNTGMELALKNMEWDYTLIMGDDDLIASDAWKCYGEAILPARIISQGFSTERSGIADLPALDYFGFGEIYFYNAAKKTGAHFTYRSKGAANKLIGCGRMISRRAIEMAGWRAAVTMNENIGSGIVANTQRQLIPVYQADYFAGMGKAKRDGPNKFELWDDRQNKGLDNTSEIRLLTNGFPPYKITTERPMLTDIKTETNLWAYDNYAPLSKPASEKECTWFMSDEEKTFLTKTFAANEIRTGAADSAAGATHAATIL